ncbi:MAG TPA: alpha/beta fold hydrolase, partial [Candidatus Acidoferrales bacterium]|nr:alpha/beta fold hydrolase [Candidatus Acidoferrales bacterium]
MKGFATLSLQDPQAAAQELTRCVRDLGFCWALVNGFSQIGGADSVVFYDLPQHRPFWATVQELDVPFYLHPRPPLATRQQAYEGYPWLAASVWGFAVETSIHALRLMASGLFNEYPKLRVILGHLGEKLSFAIWRVGAAWKSKPSWYIVAKNDRTIQPDCERFLAKRMGATTVETASSHVVML